MSIGFLDPVSAVNFGGWLSQSPLTPERLSTFITEADFKQVASWGLNSVRLPLNAKLVQAQDGAMIEAGLAWVDKAIAWAKASGLRLIVDLHEVPGHSFSDGGKNPIYEDPGARRNAALLWKNLAQRYVGREPHVWFELLNEAVAPSAEAWNSLAGELAAGIRAADQERVIVCGSNLWNSAKEFARLKPLNDRRVAYTFHFYEPMHITHQGARWVGWCSRLPLPQPYPGEAQGLAEALGPDASHAQAQGLSGHWDPGRLGRLLAEVIEFRDRYMAPVFCGEFGVILKARREDQMNWMRDFTGILVKRAFGFAYWNYREMDFGLYCPEEPDAGKPQFANTERLDHEMVALLSQRARELGSSSR